MNKLKLISNNKPAGDQPKAIDELIKGLKSGDKHQTLLGATGTGKTFTIANVIANTNKTTLVLSHNKTLAGQLYSELKGLFPNNRVEYFISYFDYYRPEAYMPSSDTYIDKTSKTNSDIEAMRMATINSLSTNEPVIVVASVASIYGQLSPLKYRETFMKIKKGQKIKNDEFFMDLVKRNYVRNNIDLKPGTFRSRGDVIEISPGYLENKYYRLDLFGNEIESIKEVDYLTGEVYKSFDKFTIYPARSYTIDKKTIEKAVKQIELELKSRLKYFNDNNKLLEAQRLEERVKHDMDSLLEFGVTSGIENYSRYLDGRKGNERPFTILDFIADNALRRKEEALLVVDESHMMIPQLHGMYNADRSRKETLVEYGFRLPSALDNRPLKFKEFESEFSFQNIYVSATPATYEIDKSEGIVVSQIVRPTGLVDPTIEVYPTKGQVENIYDRIQKQKAKKERTFILTTTKRMAEELTNYLQERNEKVSYLHSEHKTFERDEILRKLRLGVYDTIIGINLLREGLDVPEVSLILVLDADKESFFRSATSLIQITGRAARNVNGHVVFYGDKITKSMKQTIEETDRRRKIQEEYNRKNNIISKTIIKEIPEPLNPEKKSAINQLIEDRNNLDSKLDMKDFKDEIKREINSVRGRMLKAARELDFERAAQMRDLILELEAMIN